MSGTVAGRALLLGNNVNMDLLAPTASMRSPAQRITYHWQRRSANGGTREVPQEIVVAGSGFGLGSGGEQAIQALKLLGVGAVLARNFARTFYRNAINLGLPALFFPFADEIETGDQLEIDPLAGDVRNFTSGWAYSVEPIPRRVMRIIHDGGLIPHLQKRIARDKKSMLVSACKRLRSSRHQ
jgi:3-isopropylmalate/(R)-2-methylmalate dehydratase small subunit